MDVDIVNTFSESVFIASQRKMTILVKAWDKYDSNMKLSPDLASQEVEIGKINPKKWDNFVVKVDGKMYHRLYNNRNGSVSDRIVVPEDYRREILKEIHDRSHLGWKICMHNLNKVAYWPGMIKDLKTYCNSCEQCQHGNPYTQKTAGPLQQYHHNRRFEQIHLDTWSGVGTSKLGNKAVLVMTDRATRFVMAVPIADKKAPTIAKAFVANWIHTFGIPENILTDGINSTTGETPYFLVFGRKPRTVLEMLYKVAPNTDPNPHWRDNFVVSIHQGLMKAAANIKEAQKVAAEHWTNHIRSCTFKPGDLVMLRTH